MLKCLYGWWNGPDLLAMMTAVILLRLRLRLRMGRDGVDFGFIEQISFQWVLADGFRCTQQVLERSLQKL